jgi:hypothetical protein
MDLDDVLGIVQRRSWAFDEQEKGGFNLKFEEIDFLAAVARHVSILEGIFEHDKENDIYHFEYESGSRGTISRQCLSESSRRFCRNIKEDERYSSNVLMQKLSEKIQKLYKNVTGAPLYEKVNA